MAQGVSYGMLGSVVCAVLISGCDPVTTTMQHIRIKVTSSKSGDLVTGARVRLKFPYGYGGEMTDEQWIMRPGYYEGFSDARGITDIEVRVTAIDQSRGLAKRRDILLQEEFICQVEYGSASDLFRLTIQLGAGTRSDNFSVTVIDVGKPKLVKTP